LRHFSFVSADLLIFFLTFISFTNGPPSLDASPRRQYPHPA